MKLDLRSEAELFVDEYQQKGGTETEAKEILENLTELAVIMFRKGDIRTVTQNDKVELVCQLKKGSRRLKLT